MRTKTAEEEALDALGEEMKVKERWREEEEVSVSLASLPLTPGGPGSPMPGSPGSPLVPGEPGKPSCPG